MERLGKYFWNDKLSRFYREIGWLALAVLIGWRIGSWMI